MSSGEFTVDDARAKLGNNGSALEELMGYNLKRAHMLVQADYRAAMGQDGMSPRMLSVLIPVVELPGLTQSDLARRLGIERSGLVAMVDALQLRGYLTRGGVPGDRRVQALSPTAAGRAAYGRAVAQVKAHEARIFSALSTNERDQLLDLLSKVRQAHEEQAT